MNQEQSPRQSRSLIIRPAQLTAKLKALIQIPTPREFIKVRQGRSNKQLSYIEGGYVIARLNQVFSPAGWDFEVLKEMIEPKEVVVRGRLVIKDHANGYEVGKTQYGTKTRYAEVPLGDTLKAAATDCLKKCASLFGIGLDVYWKQLDEDKLTGQGAMKPSVPSKPTVPPGTIPNDPDKATAKRLMEVSLAKIKAETDTTILTQYRERIEAATIYTKEQKQALIQAIAGRFKANVKNSTTMPGKLF
jgi:hypothetical protein